MAKKKLTEEQKKEIALLRSNNEMYENTIKDAQMRGESESVINMIKVAKSDIEQKLNKFGKENIVDDDVDTIASFIANDNVNIYRPDEYQEDGVINETVNKAEAPVHIVDNVEEKVETDSPVEVDEKVFSNEYASEGQQYDVISLPSNGECYPDKMSRVPVSYLTAYDENLITSPNLYHDGLIIEYLLKNKILNKDIDINSLVSGDVDAIILFLRATSYGVEFPITVRDPETGQQIDTTIDLTQLKAKDFKLKGDENGHFDFVLPKTKAQIKFKYLTRKEEKTLERLSNLETDQMRATELEACVLTIRDALKMDKTLQPKDKQVIIDLNKHLENWVKELEKKNTISYSNMITNRMEFNIVSINGNSDRKFIHEAVKEMPAQDALALRKYILENEPGIDFEITVERPESLGGGSFKTFLEWADTVFLNIA